MLALENCGYKVLFESPTKNLLAVSIYSSTLSLFKMLFGFGVCAALLLRYCYFLRFLVRPTTSISNQSSLNERMS